MLTGKTPVFSFTAENSPTMPTSPTSLASFHLTDSEQFASLRDVPSNPVSPPPVSHRKMTEGSCFAPSPPPKRELEEEQGPWFSFDAEDFSMADRSYHFPWVQQADE